MSPSRIALLILVVLWIGFLLGVSFLATPIKFLAPSLTLPVALDIGRQTFGVAQWVELMFTTLICFVAVSGNRVATEIGFALTVAMIVALQVVWVRPVLDDRVTSILNGINPPPSSLHEVYIALDVVKLLVLTAFAVWILLRSRAWR